MGIDLGYSSTNTVIGGSLPGEGNLISGNVTGISVYSGNFSITGNRIGTDVSGSSPIPNGRGIRSIYGFGTIGGIAAGESNTIAFNINAGVALEASASISVRGNVIHSNGGLGIDLGSSGVTPNDPGDADSGANSLQNFPVLALALSGGGNTTVQGTLNSKLSANYILDFYSSPTCDASGFGEGSVYLGSSTVTTDATNLSSFNAILPSVTTIGQFVTATATDSQGKTSEFSQCRLVSPSVVTISGRVADSANQPLSNTSTTDRRGLGNDPYQQERTILVHKPLGRRELCRQPLADEFRFRSGKPKSDERPLGPDQSGLHRREDRIPNRRHRFACVERDIGAAFRRGRDSQRRR
ncbi:MAG: hypothetical protein IPK58_20170 [Acidobacteria bacterium]|nr:hypothetical protein [Acidobacteriota bacterium]